jgi:hypothetical protein
MYDEHFEAMLEELGIMYLPKQLDPGPGVLFPLRDYRDRLTHAKLHPFYDLVLPSGVSRYAFLGKKPVVGPNYFGQSDETLRAIARTQQVGLVEGYYDLLACRLILPGVPILSTGTKSINEAHVQYLRLLGVEDVHLMFDNDDPKPGSSMGAGEQAMHYIKAEWERQCPLRFHIHQVPQSDPAECLRSRQGALQLKRMMQGIFRS